MNNHKKQETIVCCVKNCQKEILKEDAIYVDGRYFCEICGVNYYRSKLNI